MSNIYYLTDSKKRTTGKIRIKGNQIKHGLIPDERGNYKTLKNPDPLTVYKANNTKRSRIVPIGGQSKRRKPKNSSRKRKGTFRKSLNRLYR